MSTWGDDNLSQFLDRVHQNQQGNRVNFDGPYLILSRIDMCFVTAGKNLVNVKPVMAGLLFLRCQYAFKAAAGMALSGQIVEAFVMTRSALEYAGYTLLIAKTPGLEAVWMDRHQGEANTKAQKKAFQIAEVQKCIEGVDRTLAGIFADLYRRSIDFGGHPNPHATFSAMQMDDRDGMTGITALALSTEPAPLAHAMKSVAQAGLTALHLFQHVFKEKFELLGIRSELESLRLNAGL